MILPGAYRRYESSQVFVQMYFTVIHLIHRRFKTRFLDSWPLASRLPAAARPYHSHAFRACVAKTCEFIARPQRKTGGKCCEVPSFSQHPASQILNSRLPPRAPPPSPPHASATNLSRNSPVSRRPVFVLLYTIEGQKPRGAKIFLVFRAAPR